MSVGADLGQYSLYFANSIFKKSDIQWGEFERPLWVRRGGLT